jgi:hypothetical protein
MNTTTHITVKTVATLEGEEQFTHLPKYSKAEVLVDRVDVTQWLDSSSITVKVSGGRLKKDGTPGLNRSEDGIYSRRETAELPASAQAVIAAHDATVAQIEALGEAKERKETR